MFHYYDTDAEEWYSYEREQAWYWFLHDGREIPIDFSVPQDGMHVVDVVAERWVWCRLNLESFELHVLVDDAELIRAWCLEITDQAESMHYKLRWPE